MTSRSNSCPDKRQLTALLEGMLPPEVDSRLTSHLDSCRACQRTLDALAADVEFTVGVSDRLAQRRENSGRLETVLTALEDETPAPPPQAKQTPQFADLLSSLGLPNDSSLPISIDGYELAEFIGRGGMGVVLLANERDLDRPVAIKFLAPIFATDDDARERFFREARAIAAVNHPHIVTVHAVSTIGSLPALVMEYVAGESLQDRIDRNGTLSWKETARVGYHVAQGLHAAHAAGIIHRDIKPANILIDASTHKAKLTDFGLARSAGETSLTQTGLMVGTPAFLAPEVVKEQPVDHRTDLFSLGSVLYAACTGRQPITGKTVVGLLQKIASASIVPADEVESTVPNWLSETIARLHERDPGNRYQSAAELARDLRRFARDSGSYQSDRPTQHRSDSSSAERPAFGRLMRVVGLATLVALAFLVGWAINRPQTDSQLAESESQQPVDAPPAGNELDQPAAAKPVVTVATETGLNVEREASISQAGETMDAATAEKVPVEQIVAASVPSDERISPASSDNSRSSGEVAAPETAVHTNSSETAPHPAITQPELSSDGPFLVETDEKTRRFETLRQSIEWCDGEGSILVSETGPFELAALDLLDGDICIRAAPGIAPILLFRPDPDSEEPLFMSSGHLVLEGLTLRSPPVDVELDSPQRSLIVVEGGRLDVVNCRLIGFDEAARVHLEDADTCRLINTEFYCASGMAVSFSGEVRSEIAVENCLLVGFDLIEFDMTNTAPSVRFESCTFVAETCLRCILDAHRIGVGSPIVFDVERCVFAAEDAFLRLMPEDEADELERPLLRSIEWNGRQNAWQGFHVVVGEQMGDDEGQEAAGSISLHSFETWRRLGSVTEVATISTSVRGIFDLEATAELVEGGLLPRPETLVFRGRVSIKNRPGIRSETLGPQARP